MHTVPRSKEDLYFFNVNTVVNLVGDARLINNPAARTHAPWPSIILIGARYYQAPVRGSLPQRKTNLEFLVTSSVRINDNKRYISSKIWKNERCYLSWIKLREKLRGSDSIEVWIRNFTSMKISNWKFMVSLTCVKGGIFELFLYIGCIV